MSYSYLEAKRDYEKKKRLFVLVCEQFALKRRRLAGCSSILDDIFSYIDIIIDNTRYIIDSLDELNHKLITLGDTKEYINILVAGSNMVTNSTYWINEMLTSASSFKFLYDSGKKSSIALDDSLLRKREEVRGLVAPTICNTTGIYQAIQKLSN